MSSSVSFDKWPKTFAKAKQLTQELKLDYFDNPDHLNLNEALHLLLPQASLGSGIPEGVTGPPWLLPDQPENKKVNDLLRHGVRAQMATVPGTEFDTFILSNEVLAANGLMYLYLRQLDVECSLNSGVMTFSSKPDSDGAPYAWIQIQNQIIDNVYLHLPHQLSNNISPLFKLRRQDSYRNEDLLSSKRRLFFGQNVTGTGDTKLKLLQAFAKEGNVEKYIVSCFKMLNFFPNLKLYDILMRDFIQRVHGKPVIDLEEKWSKQCWRCHSSNVKLLACSICKFASYCDVKCQKSDWKHHKLLHEEIISRA